MSNIGSSNQGTILPSRLTITYLQPYIQTNNMFQMYRFFELEQIKIKADFFNVSAQLGNNILYVNAVLSYTLSDGYYDLDVLNDYLRIKGNLTAGPWYKIIMDFSQQLYRIWSFPDLTSWNQNNIAVGTDQTLLIPYSSSRLNTVI